MQFMTGEILWNIFLKLQKSGGITMRRVKILCKEIGRLRKGQNNVLQKK